MQRSLDLHYMALTAHRLLGDTLYRPGSTLPASVGGYPTHLVLEAAYNSEVRLRLIYRLPAEQQSSLNERSLGSNSVEGQFARLHGMLGYRPNVSTLLGRSARLDWMGACHVGSRARLLPASSQCPSVGHVRAQSTQSRSQQQAFFTLHPHPPPLHNSL